jgi:hypothetical protein
MRSRGSLYARSPRRLPRIALAELAIIALLVAGLIGIGMRLGGATATPVVYNSIPSPTDGNYASQPFQAQQASEFGDKVTLTSAGALHSATIEMSSWACQTGSGATCATTPGATFAHPITFNVYAPGPGPSGVGALLQTKTQTFNIPYRPSADVGNCGPGGAWYSVADAACYNGFATPITFDLTTGTTPAAPVSLPSTIIWSVAYNTQTYGSSPLGVDGPYNSLNVALNDVSGPSVGTDVDPNGAFIDTQTAGVYCDGGANGTGTFREDTGCWAPYVPMAKLTQLTQPTLSIGNASVKEGDSGTSIANVPVSLDHTYPAAVTVKWATAVGGGGDASEKATSTVDYPPQSGTVTIPAGQTAATIPVAVFGGTKLENNEKFLVNLSNPTNAVLSMAQSAIVTIGNDELPNVVVKGKTVAEGTNSVFTITLKQSFWTALNLGAATVGNTAASPGDYTGVNSVVSFPTGDKSAKSVTVLVKTDGVKESAESFFLQVTGGRAASSGQMKIKSNNT